MQIIIKPPIERKGADTSGKYDYQKDISICLLLEYHQAGDDYLFVFDYHDDLLVFDSEKSPKKSSFFQIKGQIKGKYTLNKIMARKKLKNGNQSNSIMGKMYSHIRNFKGEIKSINFITNQDFSIPYGTKEEKDDNCCNYSEICLKDIHATSLIELNQKLKKEYNIPDIDTDFQTLTFLKVKDLSVKDSSGHTKGKIAEFLHSKFPGIKTSPELMYQNIFDEVKRKTRYDKAINNLEDLVNHKGISKTYFAEILAIIGATKDYELVWSRISDGLGKEKFSAGEVLQYKRSWKKLEVERMNPTNLVLQDAIRATKKYIDNSISQFTHKTLREIIIAVLESLTPFKAVISTDILTVIILAEIYD